MLQCYRTRAMTRQVSDGGITFMVLLVFLSIFHGTSQAIFIPDVWLRECEDFQTGSLEFTTLQIDKGENNCEIICRILGNDPRQMDLSLTIERGQGDTLASGEKNRNGFYTAVLPLNGSEKGYYSCRLGFSKETVGGSTISYSISRNFQIRKANSIICKSDVGSSGVLQEMVRLYCVGDGFSFIRREPQNSITFTIGQFQGMEVVCGQNNTIDGSSENCNASDIRVEPLKVDINPKTFTSSKFLLSFNCTSHPPRLIHWAVYSANGNILDIDNQDQSTKVNTNISIDQSAGLTSISIEENPPGGNGIQRVVCYTYYTQTEIGVAHLEVEEYTRDQSQNVTSDVTYLVVISFLLIVIVVLISFIMYNFFKSRVASKMSHAGEVNVIPADTKMCDNVVYESTLFI